MIHSGGNISMLIGLELKIIECRQFHTANDFLMNILQKRYFQITFGQKWKPQIKPSYKYTV